MVKTAGRMYTKSVSTSSNGASESSRGCADARREFQLYRWDSEQNADAPVKQNDHAMDDIRYFAVTVLTKRRI